MSCPSGGSFYACGAGSKFVGCCASDPCGTTGCAAGSLKSTSFDKNQYDELPDQQCSAGRFFKCAEVQPPFWGCCSSNPCTNGGCSHSDLAGAFLSANEALAKPYLSLNTTWSHDTNGAVTANSSNAAQSEHDDRLNVGAIAGGVVGGVVGLVAIVAFIIFFLRRRKTRAARYSVDPHRRSQPELQEMYPHMDHGMAKEGPHSYDSSPAMSSHPISPNRMSYSTRPPSYLTDTQARHMSYELPGASAIEMEDNSVPMQTRSPSHLQ